MEARPDPDPPHARPPGSRDGVREALGAHAGLHGDGGRNARRPPDLHPARGGRDRNPRDGRGRRPHARRVLRGDRGAGVRSHDPGVDGRDRRRPGRQPPLRPRPPVPGARRLPHVAGALRRARGPAARVRGRRQQRGRVARLRGGAVRRRADGLVAGRVRARRGRRRPRPQPRRGRRARGRPVRRGQGRRRRLHRRLDLDGPGGGGRAAPGCVHRLLRRRRAHGRRRSAGDLHALPPGPSGRRGRRRRDRRAAIGRLAAGRQPHAQRPRRSWPRSTSAGGDRRYEGSRNDMATLGKPQRQHRIARLLEEQAGLEPGPARRAARRRRRGRHPGHGRAATSRSSAR